MKPTLSSLTQKAQQHPNTHRLQSNLARPLNRNITRLPIKEPVAVNIILIARIPIHTVADLAARDTLGGVLELPDLDFGAVERLRAGVAASELELVLVIVVALARHVEGEVARRRGLVLLAGVQRDEVAHASVLALFPGDAVVVGRRADVDAEFGGGEGEEDHEREDDGEEGGGGGEHFDGGLVGIGVVGG